MHTDARLLTLPQHRISNLKGQLLVRPRFVRSITVPVRKLLSKRILPNPPSIMRGAGAITDYAGARRFPLEALA